MKRLVTALVFIVATSVSAFAQGFPLPSGWQNQRGSDMDLYPAPPPPIGNFELRVFDDPGSAAHHSTSLRAALRLGNGV